MGRAIYNGGLYTFGFCSIPLDTVAYFHTNIYICIHFHTFHTLAYFCILLQTLVYLTASSRSKRFLFLPSPPSPPPSPLSPFGNSRRSWDNFRGTGDNWSGTLGGPMTGLEKSYMKRGQRGERQTDRHRDSMKESALGPILWKFPRRRKLLFGSLQINVEGSRSRSAAVSCWA